MGGVGEFFWLGVWNLLVLCGLVGAVLGGCLLGWGGGMFCLRLVFLFGWFMIGTKGLI